MIKFLMIATLAAVSCIGQSIEVTAKPWSAVDAKSLLGVVNVTAWTATVVCERDGDVFYRQHVTRGLSETDFSYEDSAFILLVFGDTAHTKTVLPDNLTPNFCHGNIGGQFLLLTSLAVEPISETYREYITEERGIYARPNGYWQDCYWENYCMGYYDTPTCKYTYMTACSYTGYFGQGNYINHSSCGGNACESHPASTITLTEGDSDIIDQTGAWSVLDKPKRRQSATMNIKPVNPKVKVIK